MRLAHLQENKWKNNSSHCQSEKPANHVTDNKQSWTVAFLKLSQHFVFTFAFLLWYKTEDSVSIWIAPAVCPPLVTTCRIQWACGTCWVVFVVLRTGLHESVIPGFTAMLHLWSVAWASLLALWVTAGSAARGPSGQATSPSCSSGFL